MVEGAPRGDESFRRDQTSSHGVKNEASRSQSLSPSLPAPLSFSLS